MSDASNWGKPQFDIWVKFVDGDGERAMRLLQVGRITRRKMAEVIAEVLTDMPVRLPDSEIDLRYIDEEVYNKDAELATLRSELAARDKEWHEERFSHLHYKEIAETYGQQRDSLTLELAAANQRIAELQTVIEADRTRIIDGVNALEKVLSGRFWLTEGRGSYEWNDDRYRQEFGDAARAVLKAVEPLRKIGADLTNCPPTTDAVLKARADKDKRIAELELVVKELDLLITSNPTMDGDPHWRFSSLTGARVARVCGLVKDALRAKELG